MTFRLSMSYFEVIVHVKFKLFSTQQDFSVTVPRTNCNPSLPQRESLPPRFEDSKCNYFKLSFRGLFLLCSTIWTNVLRYSLMSLKSFFNVPSLIVELFKILLRLNEFRRMLNIVNFLVLFSTDIFRSFYIHFVILHNIVF